MARIPIQAALNGHLGAQRDYVGASLLKSAAGASGLHGNLLATRFICPVCSGLNPQR